MDELGSYPRLEYTDHGQYTRDADQNGSWFGLAISGLKFLINHQRNNSITHDDQSNNTSSPNSTRPAAKVTKHHDSSSKLHILGPSVFRKALYDIPEYQSTAASTVSMDKNKNSRNSKTKSKPKSRLTQSALKQFNGNFSNYWNQRSSLRHNVSSAGSTEAVSVRSKGGPLTDGGSSTVPIAAEEPRPAMASMASSEIVHPTQENERATLRRSASFPLLHSAQHIAAVDVNYFKLLGEEGSALGSHCNFNSIPSPPPLSNSPEAVAKGQALPDLDRVRALRSWGSALSTNADSSHSTEGIVFIDHHNEAEWERMENQNETLSVISKPLPISIRNTKEKKASAKTMARKPDDDDVIFSDWSNVSSNVTVHTTTPRGDGMH